MNVISGLPFPGRALGAQAPSRTCPGLRWLDRSWVQVSVSSCCTGQPSLSAAGRRPTDVPGADGLHHDVRDGDAGIDGAGLRGTVVDSGFPSYTPKDYVPEISNGKIAVLFPCDRGNEKAFVESLTKPEPSRSSRGGTPPMSTSLGVILKRLAVVFGALALVIGVLMIFSYDIIKIDWVSFMEIQPSYKQMEDPRPCPSARSPSKGR